MILHRNNLPSQNNVVECVVEDITPSIAYGGLVYTQIIIIIIVLALYTR